MSTSISDKDSYVTICRAAAENDEVFKNFKRYPQYQEILDRSKTTQKPDCKNPNFIKLIRQLRKEHYTDGVSYTKLGMKYNIKRSTVQSMVSLSYKDIE